MFNCNGTPSVVLTLGKRMGNHELVEQAEKLALANFQTPLDIQLSVERWPSASEPSEKLFRRTGAYRPVDV